MHLAGGSQGTTVFPLEKNRLYPQSPTRNRASTVFQPWLDSSLKSHPGQYLVTDTYGYHVLTMEVRDNMLSTPAIGEIF